MKSLNLQLLKEQATCRFAHISDGQVVLLHRCIGKTKWPVYFFSYRLPAGSIILFFSDPDPTSNAFTIQTSLFKGDESRQYSSLW